MTLDTYWTYVAPAIMLGIGAVIFGFGLWTRKGKQHHDR